MIHWLLACSTPQAPAPVPEVAFVRRGLLLEEEGGWALHSQDWTAGSTVQLPGGGTAQAPLRPECRALFSVDLGDVSRAIAGGAGLLDTALAWSPDGERLAVGTYRGEVLVVHGTSGAVISRRRLTEALVKAVAWSPDGATLYVAEQSPDALLRALDPQDLHDRWTLRLADRVDSSPAPDGEDLFGVYTLPGAYSLDLLDSGDLLVAAVHGWTVEGERKNKSQLLVVSPQGTVTATWPPEPASITLWHPVIDGQQVALPVGRSATGPAPDLPIGGAQLLRLPSLTPSGTVEPPPLKPWFSQAFIWEALDVEGDTVVTGLGDGRVMLWGTDGTAKTTIAAGAPILAGEVPIAASVGHALLRSADEVLYLTSGTNIPYGAAAPELRPPSPHPAENAIWSADAEGEIRWTWHGEQRVSGMTMSPDEDWLVVGAGPRNDGRTDLFGALVFDLSGDGAGPERLQVTCPTAGPVFFRQAVRDDGRIAVAESPTKSADGSIRGNYQVTVLR